MTFTPVSKFGKDHWSMLAYIETLCVDGQKGVGTIDKRKVRCNENEHPLCGVNSSIGAWKPSFSTRLYGFFDFTERNDTQKAVEAGLQLLGHDDWDCADDLNAAGYIELLSVANGFARMTKEGSRVCGLLREHKSSGGMFATFVLNNEMATCCYLFRPSLIMKKIYIIKFVTYIFVLFLLAAGNALGFYDFQSRPVLSWALATIILVLFYAIPSEWLFIGRDKNHSAKEQ